MAFCTNCGTRIDDGIKFCPNCGTPAGVAAGPATGASNDGWSSNVGLSQNDDWSRINEPRHNNNNLNQNYNANQNYNTNQNYNVNQNNTDMQTMPSKIDKFGKFFGIILLIFSIIDYNSDPAFVTILLSAAIITGCIFCFRKKYKLKGFTIAALIIAIICLLCGVGQAFKDGLFTIPDKETPVEESIDKSADEETDKTDDKIAKTADKTESKTKDNADDKDRDDKLVANSSKSQSKSESASTDKSSKDDKKADAEAEEDSSKESKETIDGVNPELKEFLDSYEAFMDDYVDFMKSYQSNPANALTLITDYAKLMEQCEEFEKKADAWDEDDMTEADLAYYIEAMARIETKMLKAL